MSRLVEPDVRPQETLVDGTGGLPADPAPTPTLAAPAVPGGSPPDPVPAASPSDTAARLSRLEADLARVDRRVEALAESPPPAVAEAVGTEMRAVADELRHTVSELGRLLVRDLGRLAKILAGHRDSILAELRGDTQPPAPTSAAAPAPPAPAPADPGGTVPPAPPEAADGPVPSGETLDAAGSLRRRLGRRRSG